MSLYTSNQSVVQSNLCRVPVDENQLTIQGCYNSSQCINNFRTIYPRCPGRYCGRTVLSEGVVKSFCDSCPYGTRTDGWVCVQCQLSLSTYDVLYFLQIFFITNEIFVSVIDVAIYHYFFKTLLQWLVFFELIVATCISLLIWALQTNFKFTACPVLQLADFFPAFYNPINCACARDEVIYPIFSLPMYFLVAFLGVFAITHWIVFKLMRKRIIAKEKDAYKIRNLEKSRFIHFSVTIVLPGIFVIHYLFSGIFYYGLPYLIVLSWIMNALDGHIIYGLIRKVKELNLKGDTVNGKKLMKMVLLSERFHIVNIATILLFRWCAGSLAFYAILVQLVPSNIVVYLIPLSIIVPFLAYICIFVGCGCPAAFLLYFLGEVTTAEEDE